MPRPILLVFGKTPKPVAGKWYHVVVDDVVVKSGQAGVRLRHLDPDLEGLTHVLERKLPLNPLGPFGTLAQACGLSVTPDMKIDPHDLLGRTVTTQFGVTKDGDMDIVAIAPVNEENIHESE